MRQLLAEVDSAELAEWRAYYKLEPWGELVADQRHGIATATLANTSRDARRHPEPYRPNDFIYWHESHRTADEGVLKSDPEEQSRLIKQAIFRAAGS